MKMSRRARRMERNHKKAKTPALNDHNRLMYSTVLTNCVT